MNNTKKICLLNGPPGCGKDTAASHLVPYFAFQKMKFATPLKRAICGLLDMSESALERHKDETFVILRKEFRVIDENFGNEVIKYGPEEKLRSLLIDFSENYIKPKYGNTFFGRLAAREINRSASPLIIFTDSGFIDETQPVIHMYRRENICIIRLKREGCTFEGDSRSYLPDIAGHNFDVDNNGPLSHLTGKVARCITRAFGIEPNMEIELHDDR